VFSLGLTFASLVVLAVETNIFNVFCKADLWQDISEAIQLFFSTKIAAIEL